MERKNTSGQRKPKKVTEQGLKNAALFYLQRYSTSAENLRRVLTRRVERSARAHVTDSTNGKKLVDDIITNYCQVGLLNDQTYATAQITKYHRKGLSIKAIRAKLHAKGVGGDDVDRAINKLETSLANPDIAAAKVIAKRKNLGPYRVLNRTNHRQNDLATLARRGFSFIVARQVIDADCIVELEKLEELQYLRD